MANKGGFMTFLLDGRPDSEWPGCTNEVTEVGGDDPQALLVRNIFQIDCILKLVMLVETSVILGSLQICKRCCAYCLPSAPSPLLCCHFANS